MGDDEREDGSIKESPAAALAKKRWEGVAAEQRSEIMRAAVRKRWEKASKKDRKAQGAALARARKRARRKAQGAKAKTET